MDTDLLAGAHAEHLRGAAAADRDRDVSVGVLVEDDVAGTRVREGASRDRVVAVERDLELDRHPR
jgi:hypothetical protein